MHWAPILQSPPSAIARKASVHAGRWSFSGPTYYSSRFGASQTLRLELWDKKQERKIWFYSSQLAKGLSGWLGKLPDLAADLAASIETRLTQDALLAGSGAASGEGSEPEGAPERLPVAWSLEAKRAYEVYQGKADPRAFVLDSTGKFVWLSGHQWDGRPPSAHALKRCTDTGGRGCRVVDIDGHPISP